MHIGGCMFFGMPAHAQQSSSSLQSLTVEHSAIAIPPVLVLEPLVVEPVVDPVPLVVPEVVAVPEVVPDVVPVAVVAV